MKLLFSTIALGCIVACTGPIPGEVTEDTVQTADGETYQRITFEDREATEAETSACEAVGGEVKQAGLLGAEHCIQALPDDGMVCSDSSDCVGRCMISGESVEPGTETTGQCAATDNPFGCFQLVKDGRADGMLCVD
ncbi:hypothetical protein WNY37_09155 [Henriciella sp. AS95]|uniref:hypothetical protein n=1 Tax=Henriciella sp. AS95 TaxID=3135782 RepID=UPI00317D7932